MKIVDKIETKCPKHCLKHQKHLISETREMADLKYFYCFSFTKDLKLLTKIMKTRFKDP